MVNCWQGAGKSATVVLAYLVMYKKMTLRDAVKTVKEKRDIRPNNGLLEQLIELEQNINHGMYKNLIILESPEGEDLVKLSKEEKSCSLDIMKNYFNKQYH